MGMPVQNTLQKLLFQVCSYGLASAVALAVDVSVLQGLVKVAGWHYLLAQVCATAVVFLWNFVGNSLWTFGAEPAGP